MIVTKELKFKRESFWELFYIEVSHSYINNSPDGGLIPKGYVFVLESFSKDVYIYARPWIAPIIKLLMTFKNTGIRIGRLRIIPYIPTWYELRNWKLRAKRKEGEVTSGAFFINKSNLIYVFNLPPLMFKYYKKSKR